MDNVKEKIAIASDHAGFQLKEQIKLNLEEMDTGFRFRYSSEEAADYPDYGKALAQNILKVMLKKELPYVVQGLVFL